jgi:hypothetical protein
MIATRQRAPTRTVARRLPNLHGIEVWQLGRKVVVLDADALPMLARLALHKFAAVPLADMLVGRPEVRLRALSRHDRGANR